MMKKILLALALASASSLFAATGNYADWFTATPDAEPAWAWTGEDGSIITNTAATVPYWEIDADVTKAEDPAEATIFTPTGPAPRDNTVTVLDISTTFDAMYDMTTDGYGTFVGEDQPLPPPQGSLGALIVGSTTNVDESVASSNFYAWVWTDADSGTWFPLYGADIPHSLTGDVVNVRIELLYMGTATEGVNKLRYSIVDGQTVTALTNALGVALFDFTPGATKNLASVQFSGCGKVCGIAADVRNSEYFDGGTGSDLDPYLINTPDTFLELGVGDKRGSGRWFKLGDNLGDDITLAKWAPLAASDAASVNFDGSGKTITVDLAGDSFFGKLVNSTIKDLTIVANNASDNVLPVAVFASECSANEYGGVNFVNCTAAGTLHNVAEEAPVLAGFTLDVDVADGAGDTPPASVTFENCAVTAEFDTIILDDPETDKVNEAYAGCYAFVANVDKGVVAATADTTLATVNKYEAYGTIATEAQEVEEEEVEEEGTVEVALGSVPKAFNFYTNGVADNVNNIYYVEPKLSPMNAESIPTYWIAKENVDEFEFAEQGKLKFQYEGQKFTEEAPYDVATCVTVGESLGLVVEGYSPDDGDYGPGLPEFNENVCNVFVNPLVATMTWYYSSEQVDEMPFSSFTYAVGSASTEQEYDEQVLTLTANATFVGGSEIAGGENFTFEVDLGEFNLDVYEGYDPGSFAFSAGGILRTATANPLENINIRQRQEDPEESGAEESEEEIVENNVIFNYGATVYGKKGGGYFLWLDSVSEEGSEEVASTPAFARLAGGASITVTNVGDTHKDFLFSGEGTTIYSFGEASGNDTYTLAADAVVTTADNITLATAKSKLRAVSGYKVVQSDPADEHTFITVESQGGVVNINEETEYDSLEDALTEAQPNDVINFLQNVSLTTGLTVGTQVTLALGDCALTIGTGASLTIDAAVTITKGADGSVAGNILVKAGENKLLTMTGVNPNELDGVTYHGTESGATFFNGDVTYTWIGATWSTGTRPYFGGGDGSASNPYKLAAPQHLFDLKDWVADGKETAGVYFKQDGDIDMTGIAWPGIGIDKNGMPEGVITANVIFNGVYDGNNCKVTNLKFAPHAYAGLFNIVGGNAVIKNLTVEVADFAEYPTSVIECGGAAIVGAAIDNTIISNCVAKGYLGTTAQPLTHNGAGVCLRFAADGGEIVDCVSEVNIVGGYTRIGAISGLNGDYQKSVKFTRCVAKGTLTVQTLTEGMMNAGKAAGSYGVAGIIGWSASSDITITDCTVETIITTGDATAAETAKIAAFVANANGTKVEGAGSNVAPAGMVAVGDAGTAAVANLFFATVENGVATFVADDEFLAANEQKDYKVMSAGAPAIELESGVWTFDGSLFDTFGADDITASTDENINSIEKTAVNKVVTVTVSPLSNAQGVFEVVATGDTAGKSGNIKITLDDAKKVTGYSDIEALPTGDDVAAFQTALNADAGGVPVWQKLVLGLAPGQKPTVKATQDAATDAVTFTLGTLKTAEQVKATGAKVKFFIAGVEDGELKEVGETLTLPITSLFQDKKVERITVKVVVDQANQKPANN